jgi:APA family basic amino acid/polyamine antiporter
MGSSFCVLLIIYKPEFTWPGLIIALLGIPLYFVARVGNRKNQTD